MLQGASRFHLGTFAWCSIISGLLEAGFYINFILRCFGQAIVNSHGCKNNWCANHGVSFTVNTKCKWCRSRKKLFVSGQIWRINFVHMGCYPVLVCMWMFNLSKTYLYILTKSILTLKCMILITHLVWKLHVINWYHISHGLITHVALYNTI